MLNHTLLSRRVHTPVIFHSLAVILTAFAVVVAATGCTVTAPAQAAESCSGSTAPAAVILVTATSAEPAPALSASVHTALTAAGAADDACVAVAVGRHPLTFLPLTPFRRNGKPEHGSLRSDLLQQNLKALDAVLAASRETDPGLDLVGAIRTVALRAPLARTLIVVSSGVSTRDPLDLRTLGWALDPGPVVSRLEAARELANLNGWQVAFVGLGQTAGRQPRPSPLLGQGLQALWTAICRASGAARCTVDPALVGDAPPTADNDVPVVPLPAPTRTPAGFTLPGSLLFALGQSTLSPSAHAALAEVAAEIVADHRPLTVIGHADASTGTPEVNRQLSDERAHAVATELEALGVPAQQISAVRGDGSAGFSAASEHAHPELISQHRSVELHFAHSS